jgi:hypothetical protein
VAFDNLTIACPAWEEFICSADSGELGHASGRLCRNRVKSDDEVVWDDAEEDEDAGSNAAAEGSSATHGDEGSEELEDSGEPLSHSSKFPGPSSLRDWPRMMMMNQGRLSPSGVQPFM